MENKILNMAYRALSLGSVPAPTETFPLPLQLMSMPQKKMTSDHSRLGCANAPRPPHAFDAEAPLHSLLG